MIRRLKLPCSLLLLAAACCGAAPSVNVAMEAAFPSPPYLVELLETAASENSSAYYPLLDRIADGFFDDAETDSARYHKFLGLLQREGHIADPHALSTFKLALSLRTSAPRIEAHFQYYDTAVSPPRDNCEAWVQVDHNQYCSATLAQSDGHIPAETQMLPFDRILGLGKDAVLYADITKPSFGSFHKFLADKARKGELSYRVRYRLPNRDRLQPLPVSGYGVELQLKRTDYIVVDDREAEGASPQYTRDTASAQIVFDEEQDFSDLKPLSSRELASLGLNAASFIMDSENPFEILLKLTQDFPKFSTSVTARNASLSFVQEHRANRAIAAPAGINVLWMNGVQLTERQLDPHTLLDFIRRERAFIKGVTDLGLRAKQAVSLLGDQEVAAVKAKDDAPRFDWTDQLEDGRVIIWLNNLEKDKRYANFPSDLSSLLEFGYPGQIPPIRRDIFNLIVPVDFSNAEDIDLIVQQLQALVKRLLPVRFGLVPLTPTKEAEAQGKVAYYLVENYGLATLMSYLKIIMSGHGPIQIGKTSLEKALKDHKLKTDGVSLSFDEILSSETYEHQLKLSKRWVCRLEADSEVPPVFIDGSAVPREQQTWLQLISYQLTYDLQLIQQALLGRELEEGIWIPDLFLEGAASKRNKHIYPSAERPLRVLNVHKVYSDHGYLFDIIPIIEASDSSEKESWAVVTVIADFMSSSGLDLLLSALTFRRTHPGVRLEIVHNATPKEQNAKVNAALVRKSAKLLEIEDLGSLQSLVFGNGSIPGSDAYDTAVAHFLTTSTLSPGDHAILVNGRVIGPIESQTIFEEDDFAQLLRLENSTRILPVYKAAGKLGLADSISSPVAAARLTSITALSTISDLPEGIFESAPTLRSALYELWNSSHTAIDVGDPESSSIHLVALLNPTSETGQRWVPILKVLSELDGVFLRIFINPRERLEELPIKRFYRHVLQSEPSFNEQGALQSLGATFKGLPSDALLNLGMDMPPAWLVAAKDSVHDLDNLRLSSLKSDIDATYELEHILIEGHSRDSTGTPPRGVQLLLGTEREPHFADTIIMANIGYFQFKATPGHYNIHLQEGKSSEIFDIVSVGAEGYHAVPGDGGTDVTLMDFQGTTLYPRLRRKEGMEKADVLDTNIGNGGDLLSRGLKFAEGILGGSRSKTKSLSDEIHAEINIFSVASGHLYERMLNIMIVSVMKNTKHTVKFWFIEQFLSPSFKEFIPLLAEEYDFKYEMVTYKWPHWLRSQKEKQREIWGYKILFLDVLFPLSLDKVIFVDADQIVRTDMMDLINHDLEGAPYGFTPMCDSRTEMEGFRFWKQGYWEKYLRGLPYHISALYVVDLGRFRQLAAGDRLRQQYHQLSADPGSLSNLDQDLPNHMQFQIPIHSLPQEWLWCETWCSDESQKEARTIDLCNNPLTKEPKLDRARRQVPEWTVYDDEIAALNRRRKAQVDSQKIPTEGYVTTNTKSRTLEGTGSPSHKMDEL